MSSPMRKTRGSACISSRRASFRAWAYVMVGINSFTLDGSDKYISKRISGIGYRAGVGKLKRILDNRFSFSLETSQVCFSTAEFKKTTLATHNGLILFGFYHFCLGAINFRVAHHVSPEAI